MSIKIGICGAGAFSRSFVPLFKNHPLVEEVVIADLLKERAEEHAKEFGISRIFCSLDDLCNSDIDAVAIMTQRQLHGPQTLQVLKAGKHVYSAVPVGQTLEEVKAIVATVEETGLIYMMGETSYYYPSTIYCRNRFKAGDFGNFVYGEGQYHHDMSHFYQSFKRSGGPAWKSVAGIPPMHYPTHSTSMVLSVTGARATSVSCLGYVDSHEDGVFQEGANNWNNLFSNETALFRTSDGGALRINELRRIGWTGKASVQTSIYGTEGSFEEQSNSQVWVTKDPEDMTDLNELLACTDIPANSGGENVDKLVFKEFHSGVSKVHPVRRLPQEYLGLPNGHLGTHQFLVDDFAKSVAENKLPPNNVWAAARYCVPGLIAHQSAEQEGKRLEIPDFGNPPDHWGFLGPD